MVRTPACHAGGREFDPRRSRHITKACYYRLGVTGLFCVMAYFVYILKSLQDGSYYVGSTSNLEDRLIRHNEGRVKYTKAKGPFKLMYFEKHPNRSQAMKREYAIKRRKRIEFIEDLIANFGT